MERTPRLSETLVGVLRQHANGGELRHLTPLTWMIVGLMQAGKSSRTAWAPDVHSRAAYAQSTGRRFARWLEPDRIDVPALDGPLLQHALAEGGPPVRYRALDTSTLWHPDGLVRMALVDRGRAVPRVWKVLDHPSSRVAYPVDKDGLEEVAEVLPCRCHVVCAAERGGAGTHLLEHLARLGGQWRLRITGSLWRAREGKPGGTVTRLSWSPGQALFWPHVYLTKPWYGPVYLALGRPQDRQEYWCVVSADPTEPKTCEAYGWRVDSEENVLDDQSHGFQ